MGSIDIHVITSSVNYSPIIKWILHIGTFDTMISDTFEIYKLCTLTQSLPPSLSLTLCLSLSPLSFVNKRQTDRYTHTDCYLVSDSLKMK